MSSSAANAVARIYKGGAAGKDTFVQRDAHAMQALMGGEHLHAKDATVMSNAMMYGMSSSTS